MDVAIDHLETPTGWRRPASIRCCPCFADGRRNWRPQHGALCRTGACMRIPVAHGHAVVHLDDRGAQLVSRPRCRHQLDRTLVQLNGHPIGARSRAYNYIDLCSNGPEGYNMRIALWLFLI